LFYLSENFNSLKKLINAWRYNCPRCRQSPLFKKPFELAKPLDMHKHCETCHQVFEPEPGYYYGAMFLSYILSVTILLPIALLAVFYFNWSVNGTMAFIIFLGCLFFVRILRFSRALWINIMVAYNPNFRPKR